MAGPPWSPRPIPCQGARRLGREGRRSRTQAPPAPRCLTRLVESTSAGASRLDFPARHCGQTSHTTPPPSNGGRAELPGKPRMNSLLTLTHSGIADQSTATPFGISSHTCPSKQWRRSSRPPRRPDTAAERTGRSGSVALNTCSRRRRRTARCADHIRPCPMRSCRHSRLSWLAKTCINARMLETRVLTCTRLRCDDAALPLRIEVLRKTSAMR
ncbi:hypothetical protein ABIF03_004087 [Bradyrhizobium elkanii]